MAYTGFPATYQPMYYQQPQYTQQPTNGGSLIWVQGEAGAKSYLVAPNTTVALYDSERQTIYLKSADASGMPSMKVLDYTIRDQVQANVQMSTAPAVDLSGYVTKAEFESLRAELNTLMKKGGDDRE